MAAYSLFVDGAARGNPGPAGIGIVLQDGRGGIQAEVGQYIGTATNNAAEYHALIRGLQEALAKGVEELTVFSDSQLIVRQMRGEYRVKHPALKPLFLEAVKLSQGLRRFTIEHISREKNKKADSLANRGIDTAALKPEVVDRSK